MRFDLLLAELKRRKVLRVAAAYGATAFVLLQVADIVFRGDRMAREHLSAPNIAELFVAMGDTESALANLERGLAAHEPTMITIGTDWIYDPLRSHPRFVRIIQALGLPNGR